jgi:CRP-like cAMP-binding protein
MVTAEEIGSIAIFAGLDEADRERLARAAADIALAPGEYAAHEGGERALFAVLDGRIEAVKLVDGIQRVVGERGVGDIIGEVPIALGTVFPVGFRAAEKTRIPADRAERLPRGRLHPAGPREGSRQARRRPDVGTARAPRHRRRAAASPGDRRRPALGCVVHRR